MRYGVLFFRHGKSRAFASNHFNSRFRNGRLLFRTIALGNSFKRSDDDKVNGPVKFKLRDLAVAIVAVSAITASLSYPVMLHQDRAGNTSVFTTVIGFVVFAICIGYFTDYDFAAMVMAFVFSLALFAAVMVMVVNLT